MLKYSPLREPILKKRVNRTPRVRGNSYADRTRGACTVAPRALPRRSRQNPKFPYLIIFSAASVAGCGRLQKILKGKFWFCSAVSSSEKRRKVASCLRTCFQSPLFSVFTATRGFLYASVVLLTSAHILKSDDSLSFLKSRALHYIIVYGSVIFLFKRVVWNIWSVV